MLWVKAEAPADDEPQPTGWGAPLWLARATAPQAKLEDEIAVDWWGAFKRHSLSDDMSGAWRPLCCGHSRTNGTLKWHALTSAWFVAAARTRHSSRQRPVSPGARGPLASPVPCFRGPDTTVAVVETARPRTRSAMARTRVPSSAIWSASTAALTSSTV